MTSHIARQPTRRKRDLRGTAVVGASGCYEVSYLLFTAPYLICSCLYRRRAGMDCARSNFNWTGAGKRRTASRLSRSNPAAAQGVALAAQKPGCRAGAVLKLLVKRLNRMTEAQRQRLARPFAQSRVKQREFAEFRCAAPVFTQPPSSRNRVHI